MSSAVGGNYTASVHCADVKRGCQARRESKPFGEQQEQQSKKKEIKGLANDSLCSQQHSSGVSVIEGPPDFLCAIHK